MGELAPGAEEREAGGEEEREAIARHAEHVEAEQPEHDVAEQKHEPRAHDVLLDVEIRQQDEDDLVHAREERREQQHAVHVRRIEVDAGERQEVAAEREEHEREEHLKLDDLPQLEPQRIREILPRILDLAQVTAPRDGIEIRGVFFVKARLRCDDEQRHERQQRQECVERHDIVLRRVDVRAGDIDAPRSLPDDDVRREEADGVRGRRDEEAPMLFEIRQKCKTVAVFW